MPPATGRVSARRPASIDCHGKAWRRFIAVRLERERGRAQGAEVSIAELRGHGIAALNAHEPTDVHPERDVEGKGGAHAEALDDPAFEQVVVIVVVAVGE